MMKKITVLIFVYLTIMLTVHAQTSQTISGAANFSTFSFNNSFPFGKADLSNFYLFPDLNYGLNFRLSEKLSYSPKLGWTVLGNQEKANDQKYKIGNIYLDNYLFFNLTEKLKIGASPGVYFIYSAKFCGDGLFVDNEEVDCKNAHEPSNWRLNRLVLNAKLNIAYAITEQWGVFGVYRYDLTKMGSALPAFTGFPEERGSGFEVGLSFTIHKK